MRTQQIPAKTCTEAVLRQAFKGTQWCSFATNERPLKGCFRKITNDRRRLDRLIFLGAVPAISCVLGYYRFRLYGESLSLCLRERESNQRESAPGIRVSLRETDSLRSPCGPAFCCYSAALRFPRSGTAPRVVTVGHPWPIVTHLASMPNAPLRSTSTRLPDGTRGPRRLRDLWERS